MKVIEEFLDALARKDLSKCLTLYSSYPHECTEFRAFTPREVCMRRGGYDKTALNQFLIGQNTPQHEVDEKTKKFQQTMEKQCRKLARGNAPKRDWYMNAFGVVWSQMTKASILAAKMYSHGFDGSMNLVCDGRTDILWVVSASPGEGEMLLSRDTQFEILKEETVKTYQLLTVTPVKAIMLA